MTGAAGGIGRATAATLAARGARVLATDRDGAPLLPLQRLLGAESFAADLSRAGDVDALLAWAGDRVDVLVNNAGFGRYERLPDVEAARTAELLSVDLEAPIRLTAGLMAPMVRRGSGHIVNVASIAGWVGVAREAVYSAAKGGLIAFSESLRYELAGTGVGVIVVVPAAVATGFFEASGRAYARRLRDRSTPRAWPKPSRAASNATRRTCSCPAGWSCRCGYAARPRRCSAASPRALRAAELA